jgi:hypothetical protein
MFNLRLVLGSALAVVAITVAAGFGSTAYAGSPYPGNDGVGVFPGSDIDITVDEPAGPPPASDIEEPAPTTEEQPAPAQQPVAPAPTGGSAPQQVSGLPATGSGGSTGTSMALIFVAALTGLAGVGACAIAVRSGR